MLITYTYFLDGCGRLMVADANLFTRDDSAGLTKERSDPEFMIGCTYKFKVFKLSPTLLYSIIYTDILI